MRSDTGMMLELGRYQAEQLERYCAQWRAWAWQELPPSTERNQVMRAVQAVQGRVVAWRKEETKGNALRLMVSEEEKQALRQVLVALTQVTQKMVASLEREQELGQLAAFRILVERGGQTTRAL